MKKTSLFYLLFFFFVVFSAPTKASHCPSIDYDCQFVEIQNEIDALSPAHENNKKNLSDLKTQINNISAKINSLSKELDNLASDIGTREEDLAFAKEVFNQKTESHYRFIRFYDPLFPFFSSTNASDAIRKITFRQKAIDEDRLAMEELAGELSRLKEDKETLEKSKVSLASAKASLNKQAEFLGAEVEKVAGYLSELSSKQQEILSAKFASAPVPLLAQTSLGGCSSDIGKSSGFSPRFGFFSYGVPNKTGLNQYGAKGRAESGQSYEQILGAYYDNFQIVDYGTGFNITVNGTNPYNETFSNQTYNIEEYLKRLYEMPSSWDPKALQAQAIAARSYALAKTGNGQSSIVPNEYGQVVKKDYNLQPWIDAVTATSGKVMVQNGNPISAWYSSTHGGVVLKSSQIGWNDTSWTKQSIDTPSGSAGSYSNLRSNAYDRQSPWFFCDWGYRSNYNNTAWLKEEEVVDIVNAFILWKLDSSTISHLSQPDKPTADTWLADKIKQEIQSKGGFPVNSISSMSVGWSGSGISNTISVNGQSFDAQKFKNMFNLRAPANIQIKPTCHPDSSLSCNKMYALYEVVKE